MNTRANFYRIAAGAEIDPLLTLPRLRLPHGGVDQQIQPVPFLGDVSIHTSAREAPRSMKVSGLRQYPDVTWVTVAVGALRMVNLAAA